MGLLVAWYEHFGCLHPERISVAFQATPGTNNVYGRIGQGRYVCWVSFEARLHNARTNRAADLKSPEAGVMTVVLGDSVLGTSGNGRIAFDVPTSSYDWIQVRVTLQTNCFVHLARDTGTLDK